MGNQNTIVLNGKLYDAVTGVLVHEPAPTPAAAKPKIHKTSGLVMDGVVHHSKKSKKVHKAQPPVHHQAHRPTAAQRHKPQRPATLMRSAVTKPSHKAKHHQPAAKTPVHDERTAQRLERAKAVPKSQHIQHFPKSHTAERSVTKKHAPLSVETAPAHKTEHHAAHHTAPAPPTHPPAPQSASEQLVTNALKHARAHEANQPYAKKPKRRLSHKLGFKRHTGNIAMGTLAVLLLVGFFVYQNIPNLSMRLAATRAGFSAQLPGYQPSGFSQEKLVSYSPGKVTVNFHSNSDDRQFQLTQQVSNWNSQALADNYLAQSNKQYQTLEANGKTIYIYDNSNATWVNGGVWYQIEGQSSLTSDQLIKIANSI